jgi:hypothetical protein
MIFGKIFRENKKNTILTKEKKSFKIRKLINNFKNMYKGDLNDKFVMKLNIETSQAKGNNFYSTEE